MTDTTQSLVSRLRCGAPGKESWIELAFRTNSERKEAADRIDELERELAAVKAEQEVTVAKEDALGKYIAQYNNDDHSAISSVETMKSFALREIERRQGNKE